MTISSNVIETATKDLQEQQDKVGRLKDSKAYIIVLDHWVSQMTSVNFIEIDNIDCKSWDEDYSLTFEFLYNTAAEMFQSNDCSVTIKYENIYITLEELHGQGCLQTIFVSHAPKKVYVDFEDVEQYVETGKKPLRYYALSTIETGLEILDVLDVEVVDKNSEVATLDDIWEYLLNNLS